MTDRPADKGASPVSDQEIEITPEMIEAGLAALGAELLEGCVVSGMEVDLVKNLYKAMAAALQVRESG